jgi:hypothetical protein
VGGKMRETGFGNNSGEKNQRVLKRKESLEVLMEFNLFSIIFICKLT